MISWFRLRRAPDETPAPKAPEMFKAVPRTPAPRAVNRSDGLPFGMMAYPDSPIPSEPWFGGPTPAPDRIVVHGGGLGEA